MGKEIRYIELKSGFGGSGPAWIGEVKFSKSRQTIYFNDMALKKLKNPGISTNHFDIETGDEYWISGVKKNGQDRHWGSGGKIMVEAEIVDDYLEMVDFDYLDRQSFDLVDVIRDFDKTRFNDLENQKGEIPIPKSHEIYKRYWDNNHKKMIKE